MAPEDHSPIKERIQATLEGGRLGPERHTYTALYEDGSTFRAEVFLSLITFQGKTAVQGVIRDITDQERLEKQLQQAQKLESIGTIASGVAHNFRNVLASISTNAQLVEMKYKENKALLEICERLNTAVKRGARLVDGLMQFSRKEKGIKFRVLDIVEVIKETYGLVSKSFDKKVNIQIDLPEAIYVLGDASSLSQVFMNLCTNARDAMPKGGELRIEARQERDNAKIVISDTGYGMDKSTLEKCFDPFFTTKDVDKGTGLGLSTTYGIVKEHGGEIYVYSEVGKGTTFTIYLTMIPAREGEGQEFIDEATRGSGQKILVVDDDTEMLKPIKEVLEELGYLAASVNSGKEALAKYESWKPDVVLVDRSMPEMDGITCSERIIEADPFAKIILISGYDEKGQNGISRQTKQIIKGYLTKPINLADLTGLLGRLFDD
jgi:signal transduction histidine kinase